VRRTRIAEAGLLRDARGALDHGDVEPVLAQVVRAGHADDAGTDHDDVHARGRLQRRICAGSAVTICGNR
jgi:hypothetical protein